MLVNDLCDQYLQRHASFKKSGDGDKSIIDLHVRPAIGHLDVLETRFAHISELHAKLRATPYQANRVVSVISTMFRLAEDMEWRPESTNPCSRVKRYKEKKRRRYLTDAEVKALINVLEDKFAENHSPEAALLLLLLYTGARRDEIRTMKWEYLSGDYAYLPDSKTGQRVVYFTPQALTVLARIPRCREWVIGPDINPRYLWASVLGGLKIKDLRIHDLRHCFASIGISAGESLPRIGGLLGHASPGTTQGYAHLIPSEGRAAALAIGQRFESIVA